MADERVDDSVGFILLSTLEVAGASPKPPKPRLNSFPDYPKKQKCADTTEVATINSAKMPVAYSTMQYAMFVVMRETRGLASEPLAHKLRDVLAREGETFDSNERLRVYQQNRDALHRLLARLTDYVETQSGQPSHYLDYVSEGRGRFEVEHIWAALRLSREMNRRTL